MWGFKTPIVFDEIAGNEAQVLEPGALVLSAGVGRRGRERPAVLTSDSGLGRWRGSSRRPEVLTSFLTSFGADNCGRPWTTTRRWASRIVFSVRFGWCPQRDSNPRPFD